VGSSPIARSLTVKSLVTESARPSRQAFFALPNGNCHGNHPCRRLIAVAHRCGKLSWMFFFEKGLQATAWTLHSLGCCRTTEMPAGILDYAATAIGVLTVKEHMASSLRLKGLTAKFAPDIQSEKRDRCVQ